MEINKNLQPSLQSGTQTQAVTGSAAATQNSNKDEKPVAGSSDTVTISREALDLLEAEGTVTPFNGGGNEPPSPPPPPTEDK